MTVRLFATAASILALASGGAAYSPADPRTGNVLVANQQSASASLIDLSTDTARIIAVGQGPHEAVIAPCGRVYWPSEIVFVTAPFATSSTAS